MEISERSLLVIDVFSLEKVKPLSLLFLRMTPERQKAVEAAFTKLNDDELTVLHASLATIKSSELNEDLRILATVMSEIARLILKERHPAS